MASSEPIDHWSLHLIVSMFVPVSQLDCPLPYWQTLFNFESPVHSTEVGEQHTIIKYWWKYSEREFPAQNHLTHEKTYSSIISIKVERQWCDFIFHISTSKQQTVLGMFSLGKNLRGTSGACRILFAVMAGQLLANPPGYPGRRLLSSEKSQPIWHGMCSTWVWVYFEKEKLVSLFTRKFCGICRKSHSVEGWRWRRPGLFFILYVTVLPCGWSIGFLRAATISRLGFV